MLFDRLVMLALAARWATNAANKAAAALWDWTHACLTCCHQGEIDCGSQESSTVPEDEENVFMNLDHSLMSLMKDAKGKKDQPFMLLRATSCVCRF